MSRSDQLSELGKVLTFARGVHEPREEAGCLQRGVELAAHLVHGCDAAGVMIITGRGLRTEAATADLVWQGDKLQYEFDEGPSLDAVATGRTVVSNDVPGDPRWTTFGPMAADRLGLASVLSLHLCTGGRELGSLNLYSLRPNEYQADDVTIAEALAAQLAIALSASQEIRQRGEAMTTRTVIGQAQGILMERYRIDAERAFQVLRRLSQSSNTKIITLARELVEAGDLPSLHPTSGEGPKPS